MRTDEEITKSHELKSHVTKIRKFQRIPLQGAFSYGGFFEQLADGTNVAQRIHHISQRFNQKIRVEPYEGRPSQFTSNLITLANIPTLPNTKI